MSLDLQGKRAFLEGLILFSIERKVSKPVSSQSRISFNYIILCNAFKGYFFVDIFDFLPKRMSHFVYTAYDFIYLQLFIGLVDLLFVLSDIVLAVDIVYPLIDKA